nr:hypothetical protein [Tanacetum cinerariifolium]
MQIPEWMFTKEMKLTRHYQLYASTFRLDVPTTQSLPIESTQGTHRTAGAPRPPNPAEHHGESSAPRKPNVIRIRRRSQLDPKSLIPTAAEIDIASLDKATQLSIATTISLEDFEAQQNVKRVKEHMVEEEIEKIIERNDDVDVNKFLMKILIAKRIPT